MSTTTAGAAHGGKRNNGATVLKGGAIDNSATVTNAPYTEITAPNNTQGHGSRPYEGASWNQKANASGSFAVMTPGKYVTRKIAEELAGVANTVLLFGSSDYGRRSIHVKTNRRSYQITDWSYITGAAQGVTTSNDDFGDDHAATPTRAIPGELVYTDHAIPKTGALAVPLQDDYKPKTG